MTDDAFLAMHAIEPDAVVRAARGDHDAQLAVANFILAQGMAGRMHFEAAAASACMLAKMASMSGSVRHVTSYAAILLAVAGAADCIGQSPPEMLAELQAEALGLIEAAAEAGDGPASIIVPALAKQLTPAIIERAKVWRNAIVCLPDDEPRPFGSEEVAELTRTIRNMENEATT